MQKIILGVLAYNEEDSIVRLFSSLKDQTLFLKKDFCISIHIIANGCTDNTTSVSISLLDGFSEIIMNSNIINTNVTDLKIGDKSSSWNYFIHNICDNEDYVILIDADITFTNIENLENLVKMLNSDDDLIVSTSKAIKECPDESSFIFSKLSSSGSSISNNKHTLCGQLYTARLVDMKKIYLPKGLPVEDGFIRAMILTNSFSEEEKPYKILQSEEASHYYTGEKDFKSLIRHQSRIVVGSVLNFIIFDYIKTINDKNGLSCMKLKKQLDSDPKLIENLILAYKKRNKLFPIPVHFYLWKIKNIKNYEGVQKLIKLPLLFMGMVFDSIIAFHARKIFLKKKVIGHW